MFNASTSSVSRTSKKAPNPSFSRSHTKCSGLRRMPKLSTLRQTDNLSTKKTKTQAKKQSKLCLIQVLLMVCKILDGSLAVCLK